MTRTGALIGLLCALALAAASQLLLPIEWELHDAITRVIAVRTPPDPRIVIVGVSDEALRALEPDYGRPPFPREVYAIAIEELRRAGARVIAIDVALTGEDAAHPEGDRGFAEALRGAPVVLAVPSRVDAPRPATFASKLWRLEGAEATLPVGVDEPSAMFREAAGISGVRLAPGNATNIHEYLLAEPVKGGGALPSLALETVRQYRGAPRAISGELAAPMRWHDVTDAQKRARRAETKDTSTRDPSGDVRYPLIGFHKLVVAGLMRREGIDPAGELAPFEAKLRDKIVFIGYTALGLFDLRVTPLSPRTPGVEIHANAADDLLNNTFNRYANLPLTFALMIVIAALFGAAIGAIRSQLVSALIAIAGVGVWAAATFIALQHGFVVRGVAGMSSIALTWVAITAVEFAAEQRQTLQLKTTFGRYVSPQILTHILAHPEKVQLGGERRDLTILFSDIRGFTSISEASEPEQVVEMLNEYLTRMVEILLAHGGTLDKFIGDAVMGFWNAPAFDPEHPRRAVRCAIEMIAETARLRERWETEGKAAIRIGIGINTGDAVVGNIGAEQVFGYTVIGDAVNLASRLESLNKEYKTEIIVSEFTLARIGEEYDVVYLDDVKVKGKANAVKIYEVRGMRHEA
ncbi:MAG: adenylate cyclase [Acidobacteria bacterium]|nr:adenylate cyclase [Acidobacteriota bacterium]